MTIAEKHFTESTAVKRQRNKKLFQTVTLIALFLFWIGYGFALYKGNHTNIVRYSYFILVSSMMNIRILFTREKAQNKTLNILAKVDGILLFIGAVVTILLLILK